MMYGSIVWLVLLCMTACSAQAPGRPLPEAAGPPQAVRGRQKAPPGDAAAAKIASSLRQVAERLRDAGITAANATMHPTASYSTPAVRVDRHGNLHVMLLVTTVNPHIMSLLAQQEVQIEHIETELRTIQAWVPFDRLERLAALQFVRSIRPPHYAYTR